MLQVDELYKICGVMGSPTRHTWPEGLQLATAMGFTFPSFPAIPLGQLMPSASQDALDLMASLCNWDPAKRPTAVEAMQHPFFQVNQQATLACICCQLDLHCRAFVHCRSRLVARSAAKKLGEHMRQAPVILLHVMHGLHQRQAADMACAASQAHAMAPANQPAPMAEVLRERSNTKPLHRTSTDIKPLPQPLDTRMSSSTRAGIPSIAPVRHGSDALAQHRAALAGVTLGRMREHLAERESDGDEGVMHRDAHDMQVRHSGKT